MSFSSQVKEELSYQMSSAMHCRMAELAAIISGCGKIIQDPQQGISINIHTENAAVARKYFTLLRKTYMIEARILVRSYIHVGKSRSYIVTVDNDTVARKILLSLKFMNAGGAIVEDYHIVNRMLLRKACCKRAFLRGIFLAAGSMNAPEKTYHFEIVCGDEKQALQIQEMMKTFDIEGKLITRKKYHVVYIKDAARIVDMLGIMEAHVALMQMENVRILKEMRNSVNRRVNCETANISKTVSAAVKQIEDIRLSKATVGFGELSDGLKEVAELRLEYPEASLVELGKMLSTPVGKSGVNHRLRKLGVIADEIRAHER